MLSRAREYKRYKRDNGLCVDCGQSNDTERYRCSKCVPVHNKASNKSRKKNRDMEFVENLIRERDEYHRIVAERKAESEKKTLVGEDRGMRVRDVAPSEIRKEITWV